MIVENSHLVTSPLTGVIILSDIKAGSQVSAGDKLARLDVTDASHQLQLLQAQLAETALQKDQAKASLEFEKQLELLVGESLALAQSRQSRTSQLSQKGVMYRNSRDCCVFGHFCQTADCFKTSGTDQTGKPDFTAGCGNRPSQIAD